MHSGAAATLEDVIKNVEHRTAGLSDGSDLLTSPVIQRFLVQFLKSIDRDTRPIFSVSPPAAGVCGPQSTTQSGSQ